ncbi:hypothetical protein pb186bvf_015657 [Paramecium bursaria]
MGCGSSNQSTSEPDKSSKRQSLKSSTTAEIEDLIGKKIPKLLIQPEIKRHVTAAEEEQQQQKNEPPSIQEDRHRGNKKAAKKYRGGDDVNEQIFENITREDKDMKQTDIELIKQSFKKHSVFFSLSTSQSEYLIKNMFHCTQREDEYIFKQGDQASSYFVIERGQVQIIINDKNIKTLQEGDYFGEIALLYNATRSASVKTITECSFWSLDRKTFKRSIEEITMKEYDENRKFINEVTFFSFMTAEQRDLIAHALITTKFDPGSVIVNEGDQADSYYVIKSGSSFNLERLKRNKENGSQRHEQALYEKATRGATVKADSEVRCLTLGRDQIMKILGDKVQIIIFINIMRWSFEKSPVLKNLSKLQLEKIALRAQISNYKNGQVIIEGNKPCDKLVVVLEGCIINKKQDNVAKGLCFGDQYLSKESRQQIIETDYVMVGDGVLATIPFAKLFQILGGDLETALKKNENGHEKKIQQLGDRADASHIKVEDLIFIKKLGQGQFGWVYLVKHKEIDKAYALKSVSKGSIIEQNLEKHILQEKAVLEAVNFPFIMQFVRTFKDEISVYFLLEYIKGMELFDVIREIGLLQKYETQFYVATMMLCLEYLHSRSIIYRDLKPENIMINDQGYMNLIDLGTAKPLTKQKGFRTYTIIGTPHYMAPEIILGKGYTFSVDLWSVGICMYEFYCGGVPYAEDAEDPYYIYEEIMNTQLKFPTFLRDRMAKKLMEQLLSKQPEARLGASYSALKANPWFDDLDFDKLFNRELKAPYVPPKDRYISDQEIERKFQQGKSVVSQIKSEQDAQKIKYRKDQAKDPNWDKDF